nr:hypothetical protein HK105_003978 [Polyrhizophydium stewartii]
MPATPPTDFVERVRALPWFVRQRVYEYAGALTAYMHHEPAQPVTRADVSLAAVDCFLNHTSALARAVLPGSCVMTWELLCIDSGEMEQALYHFARPPPRSAYTTLIDLRSGGGMLRRTVVGLLEDATEAINRPSLNEYLIGIAAALGRCDVVCRILAREYRNPYSRDMALAWAAQLAATHGHADALANALAPLLSESKLSQPNLDSDALDFVRLHKLGREAFVGFGAVDDTKPFKLFIAAAEGDLETARDLCSRGGVMGLSALVAAARGGHYFFIERALGPGAVDQPGALLEAALAGGHEHVAELLVRVAHAKPMATMLPKIAGAGSIAGVQWLMARLPAGPLPPRAAQEALDAAAIYGDPELVRLLVAAGAEPGDRCCSLAATCNNIAAVRYLFRVVEGCDWETVLSDAMSSRAERVVQFISSKLRGRSRPASGRSQRRIMSLQI